MSYRTDRGWSDRFIPDIKKIVGPLLLEPAPFEVDANQATDLILLRARDMMIAARVRRPGFWDRYQYEFTIRSRRDSGAVTELSKIINGWDMKKIERDVRPNQVGFDYPPMTEEELAAFKLPAMAADNCHLFCWTTHKFLPMALRLLEAWGFKYVCTFVWHKAGGFQPVGLPQYNCEFALYARKGSPKFVDTKNLFCCFDAPRREHSRKPDIFYETVRRVCAGRCIDVFSREKREGFDQYGDEADKFKGVAT